MYQAQLAYVYGLPENLAIASVTSTPAEVMGMGHRIGYVKEGQYLPMQPLVEAYHRVRQAGTLVSLLLSMDKHDIHPCLRRSRHVG